jgi:hypothetical protein
MHHVLFRHPPTLIALQLWAYSLTPLAADLNTQWISIQGRTYTAQLHNNTNRLKAQLLHRRTGNRLRPSFSGTVSQYQTHQRLFALRAARTAFTSSWISSSIMGGAAIVGFNWLLPHFG